MESGNQIPGMSARKLFPQRRWPINGTLVWNFGAEGLDLDAMSVFNWTRVDACLEYFHAVVNRKRPVVVIPMAPFGLKIEFYNDLF